ncbi:hypothetical protein [Methanobacterium sp.]|uniref:hypothetical protein n=1 Tax=Methanobacterium sp. TaxID=2164 RepID=UPI003C7375B7
MSLNPFSAFLKTIKYVLTRKIHFPKNYLHKTATMEDGQQFNVFRHVIMSTKLNGQNAAIFKVRFHLASMSPEKNIPFSRIPMLFILGLPGFRAKLWTLNKNNGDFQGIYQWDSLEDAQNYANSFALNFMTSRSVPGSVSYEIIPNTSMKEYIKSLKIS